MGFIPFEKLEYNTKLTKMEVLTRVGQLLGEHYEGTFEENGFTLNRVKRYSRNSFLPVIKGRVEETVDGTIVQVRMRLNLFVLVFMCFWCLGAFAGFVVVLLSQILEEGKVSVVALAPLGALLAGYTMATGFFKISSVDCKDDFNRLFGGWEWG